MGIKSDEGASIIAYASSLLGISPERTLLAKLS